MVNRIWGSRLNKRYESAVVGAASVSWWCSSCEWQRVNIVAAGGKSLVQVWTISGGNLAIPGRDYSSYPGPEADTPGERWEDVLRRLRWWSQSDGWY